MSAIADLLRAGFAQLAASPWLGSVLGALVPVLLALALGRALERALSARRQISAGPLFLLSALIVAGLHALLAIVAAIRAERAEVWLAEALAEWLGIDPLLAGAAAATHALPVFIVATFGLYLVVTLLLAWAFGVLSGEPGGAAGELEEELGTTYGPGWYRLVGYIHPEGPEPRFVEWAAPLAKALGVAAVVAMPLAIASSLPVGAFAAGLVLADAMRRVVSRPPARRPEEEKKDAPAAAAAGTVRDPDQLVRALQVDRRGPMLRIENGGVLAGCPEHLADKTRVAEESPIVATILEALGIEGFYVHQEAAAEALLAGRDVLMEAPPLSGRRTLGDVLAMRGVLLDGRTVLYLSPTKDECARRAEAFARVAQRSNWRWAILARDLAGDGRAGLDPRVRQPQIVFATPEELHADLCRLHADWDDFLGRLGLIVAIDLDRYLGARGANFAHALARLARLVERAGGAPRILSTIAPWGPDVQSFAERLVGRPLTVIGPESDSRGSPSQLVLIGGATQPTPVHAAVLARGVAIACGYGAEVWGFDGSLTEFEQEQQVNKVLLAFGKAVVSVPDRTHLRFDHARAIVARMSAADAAMIPFFTRHVGRMALGVAAFRAEDVAGHRAKKEESVEAPFQGFTDQEAVEKAAADAAEDAANEAARAPAATGATAPVVGLEGASPAAQAEHAAHAAAIAHAAAVAAQLASQPELLPTVWIPDDDAFSHLLASEPDSVHPDSLHPMLALGSRLVAGADSRAVDLRHLACAASELPIDRADATRLTSAATVDALLAPGSAPSRVSLGTRWSLGPGGRPEKIEVLNATGDAPPLGSTAVASDRQGRLVNRAGGELVLETDAERLMVTAYPGRVLLRGGRRYRIALPQDQDRAGEGMAWAEPERRSVTSERIRSVKLTYDAEGHSVSFGGAQEVRIANAAVELTETVLGVRTSQVARGRDDQLLFDAPIEAQYGTRAAIIDLPAAAPGALEALERLVRVTLPAFLRHEEDDVDVVAFAAESGESARGSRIAVIDRHVGGAGFARAASSDVVRHALYWAQRIVVACGSSAACRQADGCSRCVLGAMDRRAPGGAAPSRTAAAALLVAVLGEADRPSRAAVKPSPPAGAIATPQRPAG